MRSVTKEQAAPDEWADDGPDAVGDDTSQVEKEGEWWMHKRFLGNSRGWLLMMLYPGVYEHWSLLRSIAENKPERTYPLGNETAHLVHPAVATREWLAGAEQVSKRTITNRHKVAQAFRLIDKRDQGEKFGPLIVVYKTWNPNRPPISEEDWKQIRTQCLFNVYGGAGYNFHQETESLLNRVEAEARSLLEEVGQGNNEPVPSAKEIRKMLLVKEAFGDRTDEVLDVLHSISKSPYLE